MGQFKPMVKMMTDEPSVILKLKKGGKVKAKQEEHGHMAMHHTEQAHKMHAAMEAEEGHAPKKPSMAERRKAMNPNLYKKGGKVAHKALGGGMPMAGSGGVNMMPQATGRSGGINPNPMMGGMGPAAIAQLAPAIQAARAAQVKRALTGMKKGGSASMSEIKKLERELHHHEKLSASRAHGMKHKASGGEIDRDETKTTIEHDEKPFVRTKMVDDQHHDKRHGTGNIKEGRAGGYKMGGTIEGNEAKFENTKVNDGDHNDPAHGTSGVRMGNAGGFKKGGRMDHKAAGGAIEGNEMRFAQNNVDGTPKGKTNTKTGEVKESNAGGYRHGGHASKKAYATGGNVVSDGKAVKMPRHFVSKPVANSMQSGTFKTGGGVKKLAKGGRAEKEEKPNLRLISTHTGPKGHVAKVYKDKDWGEHRVRFYSPEGKHYTESDYHTDDKEDAHDTAKYALNRYKQGGKTKRYAEGDSVVDDAQTRANNKAYANWEKLQKEENEADANMIPNAIKRGVNAVKGMFGSKSPESVTKTEKSITVTPAKRRGGSMK